MPIRSFIVVDSDGKTITYCVKLPEDSFLCGLLKTEGWSCVSHTLEGNTIFEVLTKKEKLDAG